MTTATPPPFHPAVPVHDIEAARKFYGAVLGFERGRSAERWTDWNLADRHRTAGTDFVIEPTSASKAIPGEQWTMFFLDPLGNAMKFKAFRDINQLLAV